MTHFDEAKFEMKLDRSYLLSYSLLINKFIFCFNFFIAIKPAQPSPYMETDIIPTKVQYLLET